MLATTSNLNAATSQPGVRLFLALLLIMGLSACASLVSTATGGMASNLSAAILNQDDPETVRDGAPAFLLMLDSFVQGSPDDEGMLNAAAELYAAYGIVFVDDAERAQRLTRRSIGYSRQAMCSVNAGVCDIWLGSYEDFEAGLSKARKRDAPTLFTLGLTWLAYIQAHSSDWSALADLPRAEAVFLKVQQLDPTLRPGDLEHYLGVLNTLRPPALGGQFDKGLAHYQRAIELTDGLDLGIKVDFANYYARTLYDRELHDQLLQEVLATDPVQPGLTLFNTLAQRNARAMLDSADSYF